jgi:excisionase family DNA binding protein
MGVSEVAALLGYSEQNVCRMIREGELQAVRIGRTWAIPQDCLADLFKTTPFRLNRKPKPPGPSIAPDGTVRRPVGRPRKVAQEAVPQK